MTGTKAASCLGEEDINTVARQRVGWHENLLHPFAASSHPPDALSGLCEAAKIILRVRSRWRRGGRGRRCAALGVAFDVGGGQPCGHFSGLAGVFVVHDGVSSVVTAFIPCAMSVPIVAVLPTPASRLVSRCVVSVP